MRFLARGASVVVVYVAMMGLVFAQEPIKVEEYRDTEYGYGFQYPAGWKLQKLPEGETKPEVRVALRGPTGSSFTVVVEKSPSGLSKEQFESDPNRSERIQEMMRQTTDRIYRTITTNIGASEMKVGERRDISNDAAVKFYISTLHAMKTGKPVIVAGIHAYPFGKNYSINFVLTAFLDRDAVKENAMLTTVFNSFYLLGEPRKPQATSVPANESVVKPGSK